MAAGLTTTSSPSVNFTPWMIFGNWLWPSSLRQVFCAPSTSLKTMASAVLFERQPFDGVRRAQMLPVLGGEVVECEQRLAILAQAFGGLIVFNLVALDEGVESSVSIRLRLGHPDRLQGTLGLRMLALRQPVQDVRRFVHPAALLPRLGPHLAERLPEAERTVGDGQLRRDCQPAPLQIEQQGAPVMGALARAIGEANQLLFALWRCADDDEDALRVILQTRL